MVWTGDVDLNDGKLQLSYSNYRKRIQMVSSMNRLQSARNVFPQIISQLNEDFEFLQKGKSLLKKIEHISHVRFCALGLDSKTTELEKMKEKEKSAKLINDLNWDIQELHHLFKECQWAIARATELQTICTSNSQDNHAISSDLLVFTKRLETFVRGIVRKQREPASHAMVFMIRPESRAKKPYALPVQLLPNRGLKDCMMRQLTNQLKLEMKYQNMEVVGMINFSKCTLSYSCNCIFLTRSCN